MSWVAAVCSGQASCGWSGRTTTGPDREHAEVSKLTLQLLQSALVHINTLLHQAVREVPEFHDSIGDDERRALVPLFRSRITPYGRFRLNLDTRLDLNGAGSTGAGSVESILQPIVSAGDRLACVRAGARSAAWAPQGGAGQKQVRDVRTLPDVENVRLAPSQGHEWPRRAA